MRFRPALPALLVLLMMAPAAAAEAVIPSLSVNGEGKVKVEPDVVLVNLGVVTQAATARAAMDANSADAAKLLAAVKAAGIADKDVATIQFSVDPIFAPPPPGPVTEPESGGRIVGYRVTNQVRVRIEGVERSGDVLDRVVAAGGNRIGALTFDIANPDPLRDRAIREAIADARRKAELMAEAAGVRLGRILSLTTGDVAIPAFEARVAMAARAAPISPGERTVSANASLVFEILPK